MRYNLQIVFRQELTEERYRVMVRRWARHITDLVVDFARMPRITADNVEVYVDDEEVAMFPTTSSEGKGFLAISGHIGCWELHGHAASVAGRPVAIVVRPLGLEPVDRLVTAIRQSGGQRVIGKWGALWGLSKRLQAGDTIGLLADEDVRKRAVFVPFLGTLASANPAVAQLQLASGSSILVATMQRVGRERYRYRAWGMIPHENSGDAVADRERIVREISTALSRAILAAPEQWLWGSRRFFTRPEETLGDDGLPPEAENATPSREEISAAAERFWGAGT